MSAEPTTDRDLAAALGQLFVYPGEDYRDHLTAARALCQDACGADLAARAVADFEDAVADLSLTALQDLYTRSFDLTPLCVPYLSVHLWGQESFKRARLMTGLDEAYRRSGIDRGGELPDHLGLVLRSARAFEPEEWDELVSHCLAGPLASMLGELQEAANPFRHAMEAVRRALGVAHVEAKVPQAPHWRRRERRNEKGAATAAGAAGAKGECR